jgi:hypothetical protein
METMRSSRPESTIHDIFLMYRPLVFMAGETAFFAMFDEVKDTRIDERLPPHR